MNGSFNRHLAIIVPIFPSTKYSYYYMDNQMHQHSNPRDKIRNAYLLFYDRVKPIEEPADPKSETEQSMSISTETTSGPQTGSEQKIVSEDGLPPGVNRQSSVATTKGKRGTGENEELKDAVQNAGAGGAGNQGIEQ